MVVATAIAAAVLAIAYRFICIWENNRRDKTGTLEGFEHAYEDDLTDKTVSFPLIVVATVDETDLRSQNPQFRYII